MKRSLLHRILKPTLLTIPAAALMLGASQSAHGQAQIGISFSAYHATSITATAFGIDPTNWYATPVSGIGIGYWGDSGSSVIAVPAGGNLNMTWSSANTYDSSIGDDGTGHPTPGNAEVTWGYLDDGSPGYQVNISGLRSFAGSFSVQTIAASDNTTGFANMNLSTNNVLAESLNYTNDPSQFTASGNHGSAISTLSATYSATAGVDSITLVGAARNGTIRSTLAGLILTYTPANNPPLVTTQPQSITKNLFAGDAFSLSVVANGPPAFSYQWRQNGTPIANATNSTYINSSAAVGDSGNYDCVITNNYGSITSAVAVVTVQPLTAPTITRAPISQSFYQSYPATFSVSALGGRLSYQWSYNGTPIAGATNTTYSIASVNANYAGTYTVAVSNPVGPTANASAALTIKVPAPGSYEEIMSQTRPDLWFRYSEPGPFAQDIANNTGGSLGNAGQGAYVNVIHSVPGAIVADNDTATYFTGVVGTGLKVPFNAALNTSTFTAEAWVNPATNAISAATPACALSCGDFVSPRKGWLIYQAPTGWDLRTYNNNGATVSMEVVGGGTPVTNSWTHLAVTFDGTILTLYVNGASVGTATNTGSLYVSGTAGPFAVGARADGPFPFNGKIDEVAAYGTALSASQIQAHYQNGINPSPAQSYRSLIISANPLTYLRLDETTPNVAQNSGTAGTAWNGQFVDAAGIAGQPNIFIGQAGPLPPTYIGFESTNRSIAMTNGYCATPLVPIATNVTLVSWAYLQNPATSGDLGWIGWLGNGGLYVTASGVLHYQWPDSAASYNFASGLTIPAQTWVFTALVVGPTQTTIYMSSGTNLLSATHTFTRSSGLNNTAPFGFGGNQAGRTDRTYIGGLDESAVYTRSLTSDQINAIFQASIGATHTLQIVPGGSIKDSKPVGTPHNGLNYKTTWLASGLNFDQSVRRTGVEQFSQTNNSQITVPADPDFNSTNGTICFWVNYNGSPTGTGNEAAMLFDRRTTNGAIIGMTTGGSVEFQPISPGTTLTGTATINDGDWHHVAITYGQTTNDTVSIYVDGNLDTTGVNATNWSWPTSQEIELGRSHDSYWFVYNGGMDDFRIYNRILTASEVQSIYQNDALVDTSALKLQFNFDADPALFGQSLSWSFGSLQSSPTIGPGAVWTPMTNAVSPLPLQANPSIPALFYRTALAPY